MITDEDIHALAKESGDGSAIRPQYQLSTDQLNTFARAIYQLGLRQQRESDAALFHAECDRAASFEDEEQAERASEWAAAIMANTGE